MNGENCRVKAHVKGRLELLGLDVSKALVSRLCQLAE